MSKKIAAFSEIDLSRLRRATERIRRRAESGELRVALDIDGVICNLIQGFIERLIKEQYQTRDFPLDWTLVTSLERRFTPKWLYKRFRNHDSFWLDMRVLERPPFTPRLYCTNRGFPDAAEITRRWMKSVGVPLAPVFCIGGLTGKRANKGEFLVQHKIDVYVEDDPQHWASINREGVLCFLIDRPWNRDVNAGRLRIDGLFEIEPVKLCARVIEILDGIPGRVSRRQRSSPQS